MPSQFSGDERAESLHRLAAGTVHDVNNLLALVVGCAELALDDEALSPRTRKLIEEIASVGERATSLTRHFLILGKPPAAPTTALDLDDALRSAGNLVSRAVGDRVRVQLDLGGAPQWVLAEAGQLEQVIVNLAVNARDAMPGGGSLTIASRPTGEATGANPQDPLSRRTTRVTVTDTGQGIDPTVVDRMYEPFVTTKGVGKGAGLGLAVVKAIVCQLGGTIEASTSPGRGTTFTIELPLADAPTIGS